MLRLENLLSKYLSEQEQIELKEGVFYDYPISAIKISDYNAMIKLKGQEAIDLKENEVLVVY